MICTMYVVITTCSYASLGWTFSSYVGCSEKGSQVASAYAVAGGHYDVVEYLLNSKLNMVTKTIESVNKIVYLTLNYQYVNSPYLLACSTPPKSGNRQIAALLLETLGGAVSCESRIL